MLFNLAGNAVKFTHRGHVSINVGTARKTGKEADIQFSVEDTGIGIPTADMELIFEKFTQVDSAMNRKYGGTGLGLAISKQLVMMMGGELHVESSPGVGSRFYFTLTLPIDPSAPTESPARPSEFARLRIVVVDSHSLRGSVLEEFLQSRGAEAVIIAGEKEALKALREGAHAGYTQAAICVFPGLDMGSERFARAVRFDPLLENTRLILLYSSKNRREAIALSGNLFDSVIPQPVRNNEVEQALRDLINRDSPAGHPPDGSPSPAVGGSRSSVPETGEQFNPWVLLAEDNEVNRKIETRLLQRLGCRVDSALDGAEAARMAVENRYDLILMDCQMPEVDGLEATKRIRGHEQNLGRRIPIVALTGHAMPGDKERCLASGMDDYLAKPIQLSDLTAILRRWNLLSGERRNQPAAFDRNRAYQIVGRDEETLREAIRIFLDQAPGQIRRIEDALAAGDTEAACRVAHSMKSSAASIGGGELSAAARELEEELTETEPFRRYLLLSRLREAYGRLHAELDLFLHR